MDDERRRRWRSSGQQWDVLKPLANANRGTPTQAEHALWQALRGRQLSGWRFRRQHAIGRFIVDFYCSKASLVIEVDGPSHDLTQVEDDIRRQMVEGMGLKIVRFTNNEVLTALEGVLVQIDQILSEHNQVPPLRRAERGLGGEV